MSEKGKNLEHTSGTVIRLYVPRLVAPNTEKLIEEEKTNNLSA
jgi:hypothetical protein